MRRLGRGTAALALVLAAAACSSTVSGHGTGSPPATRFSVPALEAPSTGAAPTSSHPVTLRGDAATNPACDLATVAGLERIGGGHVVGLLGLSTYSHYAATKYSCTWYFAATDISSPVIEVSWETATRSPADLVGYMRSLLARRIAQPVTGLPEVTVASIQGHDLDLVDHRTILSVRAWLHNDAGEPATATAVTKLVLSGIPR